MNPLHALLRRYTDEDSRSRRIVQLLAGQPAARIQLTGLTGALPAFAIAAVQAQGSRSQLIVAANKEEAAYLHNSLAGLTGDRSPHFFPDSFKRPLYFDQLDTANVLQRTETVNQITQPQRVGHLIVTYPEALLEQVVSPEVLDKSRISILQGESLDVDTLISFLNEYGFRREDFVYEPGQYSIRGGIVDVFSYGNEYPYRIELFDDEVESIRTFDPMTQLSVAGISRISLVPNINTRFKRHQKVSLFSILPAQTAIWVSDYDQLIDRLLHCFEQASDYADSITILDEDERAEVFRDRAFVRPGETAADLKNLPVIVFGEQRQASLAPVEIIAFHSKPQPPFRKQFELIIKHLQENTQAGIANYLFSDNPKQLERLDAIFHDLEAHISYQPVLQAIHEGFLDQDLKIACYTDHQLFERFHRYKLKRGFTADQAINLRMLRELQPGDFVVHIDHGIGRFSGLEKINVNGQVQESVRIVYKNNDLLYVSINALHKLSKYSGKEGEPPVLDKIGGDAWRNLKAKAKKKVKDIAAELIKLYALRKSSQGHAFPPDNYLQMELESSFIYEDTPDQLKATLDVKADMEKPYPMDRLICGDVGFGKTEVAIRAAYKAILGGKQVAVLVPTTILALQHYRTFGERLSPFGASIDYLNRFRTAAEKKQVIAKLEDGQVDVVIGTHALLGKEIKFKDLGLLIIDEEQKFGVAAKEKLRNLKVNVDTLTLTATPIPRTLQFSLMAARDLSVIRTPPPNRQPIHTEVRMPNDALIRDAIYFEINRGGQVFFVHNRVKDLADKLAHIRRLCPDIHIAMAHGQMPADELERVLVDFIERRYDLLLCTNIIETGLDIPNANTMIIDEAHNFGISDLHQLRGRVGRSNRKAFCYLITKPLSVLTPEARKRLRTLEEYTDLGSGFDIAMRDLDIRGAGNMLGAEQSGFIADIGYETFQRILEEAVYELKHNEFKDTFQEEISRERVFVRDVQIDTDVEMLIPDEYVSNVQERLSLYTALDALPDEGTLQQFEQSLRDRFGRIPPQVRELFDGVRLRWVCKELGFERIVLRERKLRCYFVENPQSPYYETAQFQQLIQFINSQGKLRGLSLKQAARFLIMSKEGVRSLHAANELLQEIRSQLSEPA